MDADRRAVPDPPWAAHLPAGTDPAEVDLLEHRTLVQRWLDRWSSAPASTAVVHDEGRGWLSVDEMEARSRQVARRLAGAGLVPGDRLVLSGSASAALVLAHVGALRAGLTVVPLNPAYREREVAHIVGDAAPAAALVDDPIVRRWIGSASDRPLRLATDTALGATPAPGGPGSGGGTLDRSTGGADPAWLDRVEPHDPALLVYTSGTTGAPKGAILSHANLLASAEALRIAWRWTPEDRLVLPLPLFHLHGLGVGLHGTLGAGASVVLQPAFAVDRVVDGLARHGGTLFFGVPTMYRRFAEAGRVDALGPLRLCVSGSAPLPADLHQDLRARSGQAVLERYGMTETVMNVSNPYDGERRPGSVGLPLPHVQVRLDPGTDEIWLRGPNVFGGYLDRPEANAAAFVDGWFRTGDIGALDADGYLRIVGRRTELIITGGYNVYPREIEDLLREHPGVADAAVVGVPDDHWGEQVVAVIEGDLTAVDGDALLAWAAERLAPYKRPRRLVRVDALPRNALGKVVKAQVASLV